MDLQSRVDKDSTNLHETGDADESVPYDKKERGLDKHTFSEKARKEHMRKQLYKAVSAIQEYQMEKQVWIPDILAGICQKYSAACELEAHVVGLRDEVEIYFSIR
jgi:hypothetical protein